jgi:hypothetical protein
MSSSIAKAFELLEVERCLMPLIAVEDGRPGLSPDLVSNLFDKAILPREAEAGFLLCAGFGSRSHNVSQDLASTEGSYWHAIYHRMEPDDWNAKYWFRKVGLHPITTPLSEASRKAGWNPGRNWDHSRFVEFVAEARTSGNKSKEALAKTIQMIEWRLLFEYCAKEVKA